MVTSRFCSSSESQSENQRKREKRKVLRPCQRTKKVGKNELNGDTIVINALGMVPQRLGKSSVWVEKQRTKQEPLDYSIVEIGQNTEKSRGNRRTLVVILTPEKGYQLTLVWKSNKEYNNNNNNNNNNNDIRTDHLIIINKKERTYKIVDFAAPADHRVKLKES